MFATADKTRDDGSRTHSKGSVSGSRSDSRSASKSASSSGSYSGAPSSSPGAPTSLPKSLFDYEVVDFIGEGAGSLIYVVTHPTTKQLFALKHVIKRTDKDQRFFEQLTAEFEVASRFSHPALRRCYEYKDNKTFLKKPTEAALVMELFDGTPLDHKNARGGRDLKSIMDIFIQVAQGLAALHGMGYVHCDLKPANILVDAHTKAKIIDFGQTTQIGATKERIQGTPDYISPEQVKCEPVTHRTDVFNLGATMYFVLAGKTIPTLFTLKKGENSFLVDQAIPSPRDIDNSVPEVLSNLVMECVRTNPAKRPTDMTELARRLDVVRHAIVRQGMVA